MDSGNGKKICTQSMIHQLHFDSVKIASALPFTVPIFNIANLCHGTHSFSLGWSSVEFWYIFIHTTHSFDALTVSGAILSNEFFFIEIANDESIF